MHTYSVNTNERVKVIVILTIISCFITPIINNILTYIMEFVCKMQFIDDLVNQIERIGFDIKQFTILAIFWLLYEWFDKKMWKMKLFQKGFVQIPNLSGFWQGKYKSNWNGGTVGTVKLEIKQTWTKITLISHNVQSKSYSRVASILTDTNKGINLVFQYENDPNGASTDTMYNHKGYSDLIYNESEQKLEGYYTGDQINRKAAGHISYKKNN